MKNTVFTCDRCGCVIDTDIYYLTIYAEPVKTANGNDYRQSCDTAIENMRQNLNEPYYLCEKCRAAFNSWLYVQCVDEESVIDKFNKCGCASFLMSFEEIDDLINR